MGTKYWWLFFLFAAVFVTLQAQNYPNPDSESIDNNKGEQPTHSEALEPEKPEPAPSPSNDDDEYLAEKIVPKSDAGVKQGQFVMDDSSTNPNYGKLDNDAEKLTSAKPHVNQQEVHTSATVKKSKPIEPKDEITGSAEHIKPSLKKQRFFYADPSTDSTYDPMKSHTAPREADQTGAGQLPYLITPTRLKEIREPLMYPFYNRGGSDNIGDYQREVQSSITQVHKNLNFQLPFFGFRFNYTRISLNGYLEFSDPPPSYNTYPLVFPIKEWPKVNDPSFIGIFHSKCKVGSLRAEDKQFDDREPGLYFRMVRDLRGRKDRFGVEFRERIKWDIREGVIGADSFDPKHAIITTWKNVSFAGGFGNAAFVTNTFQMILVTDEVFTYVMFNYLNLQWTTHTEAGGDTQRGEGGIPAFVGFNAGNGTRSFEYKPYSQASVIRDLSTTGNGNGKPGRHIFRIDENILLGSCNKDIDGANLPLVFAPESGNMLGGTVVNITGPCFQPGYRITCKFDVADPVVGVVVDRNRAICVQPRLSVEGYVKLEIAINNEAFKWKGKYFVETPATATQKIFFSDMTYNDRNPAEIRMTWVKQNLTTNENANIRMSLWGYRETRVKPEFLYITDLLEGNVANIGEYKIIPANYRNRENTFLTDLKFGFIQINLTESIPVGTGSDQVQIVPVIWSRPIPLAWYFGPQWERLYGSKWPVALCDQWLKDDRYLKNFAHELPQCPCKLEHALADKGRYMPDFDCDKDSNPLCYYQGPAMHCVRSGAPTLEGAEQQCCYDKENMLMLSYDQKWGSNPRRSHNLGSIPWNEATKIPTLSQWYNDMVPRFVCCQWQEDQAVGCETFRFERRPTQDCVAYQAPAVAGVYGDPHIITFDGLQYTFNGKGEFVLVKTSSVKNHLEIQGRFEQMPMNLYGEVRATQLTSIAVKGNSSTVIEVRSRPPEARWRYRMDVIADGRPVFFDRPSLKFQHFPGVTVYTPTYILNQSEVIIMLESGAGVEVIENQGYMSARIYLPWTFLNQTLGLFGNWSFDITDDFTLPDGTKSTITTNINDYERVYNDFGLKWMLDDIDDPQKGRALFKREFGRTASNYNNRTFKPEFRMTAQELIPENRSAYRTEVLEFCTRTNYECVYDYSMTLNREVAHFTSNYKASITSLRETNSKRVISCGVLETPRFGYKDTFYFTPGTKVTFECSQDFILVGDNRRECLPNGKWDLPVYGYTECLRYQEYSAREAAVTAGIVLAILIPLLLLITHCVLKAFKAYKKNKDESCFFNSNLIREKSKSMLSVSSRADATERWQKQTSPPPSYLSGSSTLPLPKRRRSYERSYRTGEPLVGRPDVEFEEKPFDLDLDEDTYRGSSYYPSPDMYMDPASLPSSPSSFHYHQIPMKRGMSSPLLSESTQDESDTARESMSPKPNYNHSQSVPHGADDYSEVSKRNNRIKSLSTVVSDV